jgi:hypothetical protein
MSVARPSRLGRATAGRRKCAPGGVVTAEAGREGTLSQRWLARASLIFTGLAVVIIGVFAGLRSTAI